MKEMVFIERIPKREYYMRRKMSNFGIMLSMQSIFVYVILTSAVIYLGYRAYLAFFKKTSAKGCANCPK